MKNDQVTPAETATILELAKSCLFLEGNYVELGCYRGDTSVLLGKLLQQHDKELLSMSAEISTQPSHFSTENQKKSTNSTNLSTENHKLSTESQNISTNNPEFSTNNGHFSTKKLWIYDSFAGLPAKTREDSSGAGANFQAGELFVTKREVVEKIRKAGLKNVIIKKAWFNELTDVDLPEQIAFGFLDGDLYESIKVSLQLVAPRLTQGGIMVVHDYNNPELPGSSRAVDEFLRSHSRNGQSKNDYSRCNQPKYKLQVKHSLAIITKC